MLVRAVAVAVAVQAHHTQQALFHYSQLSLVHQEVMVLRVATKPVAVVAVQQL
jgi:hypothetical protein